MAHLIAIVLHAVTHPLHDSREIDLLDPCLNAQLGGFLNLHDAVSREHDQFGGDTTHVEARSSYRPSLDQGHAQTLV